VLEEKTWLYVGRRGADTAGKLGGENEREKTVGKLDERNGGTERAREKGRKSLAGENRQKKLGGRKRPKRKSGKVWREMGREKEKTMSGYTKGGPRHRPWL
jgi:hypothetical protein